MMPQGKSMVRVKILKGCNPCRAKKQKCDDNRVSSCKRCAKSGLPCSWPGPQPTLHDDRHQSGSWKERARKGTLALRQLLPEIGSTVPPVAVDPISMGRLDVPSNTTVDPGISPGPVLDASWESYDNDDEDWQRSSNMESEPIPVVEPSYTEPINGVDFDGRFIPDNFQEYFFAQYAASSSVPPFTSPSSSFMSTPWAFNLPDLSFMSAPSPHLSDHFMPLPNSLRLSSKDHDALGHYQTTFSIYRTTKDPKWSTHKLLLDLGAKSTMIMRFILAVSINDVCHRQEHEASLEAQAHFELGAQELIQMINRDSEADCILVMAGFLFLYWYMPKRKSVPRERIQKLSMTVLTYLKRHKLDSRCLESDSQDGFDEAPSALADRDRPVLARLIIWIFDEDVKCGFQGTGGHLARYLTAHRERTMAVYEVSRTVLKAYWGTTYPEDQIDDDDYNAMELEMLWALTALWQDINELSQDPSSATAQAYHRIKQRFSLLEKKYSSVFLKSSSPHPRSPGDRVLINADYDVVLFHSLRVYYFRVIVSDSNTSEIPDDVKEALEIMLDIIQRTFASKSSDLHDRLQWPLFLAGIETDNGLYRKAIMSSITSRRAREALQKTIDHQSCSGKRLAMGVIKALLCESDLSSTPVEQHSFLDNIDGHGF